MMYSRGRVLSVLGLVVGAGTAVAALTMPADTFSPNAGGARAEGLPTSKIETGTLARNGASEQEIVRGAAGGMIEVGPLPALASVTRTGDDPSPGRALASRHNAEHGGSRVLTNAFEMAQVERIRLRVWGAPELGGEYGIDADATLSLPGLGRIGIAGLTAAHLEGILSEKLTLVLRRDVTVSVEIAQFRPFFMMGHIALPGAMPWRPSLNVIQAIALSGGVSRSGDAVGGGSEAQQLMRQQARSQLRFALAQLGRLKAEQEGADHVAANERIAVSIEGTPQHQKAQLQAFLARQNAMLAEQRALLRAELDGLARDRDAAVSELAAAEAQSTSISTQSEISRGLLQDIESLKDKKLVANSRYLQQRTEAITAEVRLAEARNLVDRARARVEGIDRQIVRVQQERRVALAERIEALEREVAQLEVSLADVGAGGSEEPFTLTYQIARQSGEQMKTISATVFTEVLPGDVVIVSGSASQPRLAAGGTPPVRHADLGARESLQAALEASATTAPTTVRRSPRETSRGIPQIAAR